MNMNELCIGKPRRFRVVSRRSINSEKSKIAVLMSSIKTNKMTYTVRNVTDESAEDFLRKHQQSSRPTPTPQARTQKTHLHTGAVRRCGAGRE